MNEKKCKMSRLQSGWLQNANDIFCLVRVFVIFHKLTELNDGSGVEISAKSHCEIQTK